MMHRYDQPHAPAVGDAILVDVGNSRTKFAFASGKALWRLGSAYSVPRDVTRGARACYSSRLLKDMPELPDCVVTSVRPGLNAVIRSAFSGLVRDFFFLEFDSMRELSFASAADFVAPDRVAATLAAASGVCPAIVIDLGTATTMDVIDSGRVHLGGVIMPGVTFTGDFSLSVGTAAAGAAGEAQSITGSTIPERHAAAVLGHAGAIDRLCGMFSAQVGPAKVVATGGFAPDVVPYCRGRITIDEDLTFRGSRIAQALWSTQRLVDPHGSG